MMNAALLVVHLMEDDMQERAILIYKKLLAKEVFMKFMGFEAFKEKFPNIALFITDAIQSESSDFYGFRLSLEEAEQMASGAWQSLRDSYQESE